MPDRYSFSRRGLVLGTAALLGTTVLAGCDRLAKTPWFRQILDKDEDANLYVQRLLLSDQKLAPEYAPADLSPKFKANGTEDPSDKTYKRMVKEGFRSYRLEIGGLVERPEKLTLTALRAMPSRTQITRHDCVEGWSCIGEWTGVPLGSVLQRVGLKPQARFVVFHCADDMDAGGFDGLNGDDQETSDEEGDDAKASGGKASGGDAKANMTPDDKAAAQPDTGGKASGKPKDAKAAQTDIGSHYYESIDLEDAFHPQTILAYEMNGKTLPVPHGAPLRLRLERQLGYKMAKYIMRIEVVDSLDKIGKGGGGYWEDNGYEWYAGI